MPAHDSHEVRPGFVLDFDADGRLVGIDIDHASKNATLDSLDVEAVPPSSIRTSQRDDGHGQVVGDHHDRLTDLPH